MRVLYAGLILLLFCAVVPAVTADETYLFAAERGGRGSGAGQFNYSWGIAPDGAANVHIADFYNHRIQTFTSTGTFLAKWGSYGNGNGQLDHPTGVAVDGAGNVYVADTNNHRVQTFTRREATPTPRDTDGDGRCDDVNGNRRRTSPMSSCTSTR